jgi:PAS domain S-box-containing protein
VANKIAVLVVEDSEADAGSMLGELHEGGFDPGHERVDTADALEAAIGKAPWDLVLLDYNLPRMSAEKALVVIRERLPDVPIIVVSAFVGEEAIVALMKAGAADYVPKDRMRRLCPAVERALQEAAVRREKAIAEEANRKLLREMQTILDNLPAIAFRKDRSSRYIAVNRHFVAYRRCRPEDVIGKTDPDLYPEETARTILDEDRRIFETGEPLRIEHKSRATNRTFDIIKAPLREDGGGITGIVGMAFDITDRVRSEEERKALEERLGQLRKLDAVGQLAGGVAHEFNNALSVILSYTGFLLEGIAPTNPLRADVIEIKKAGERTAALTKQLLAFSRRQNPEPRIVDVNESIELLSQTLLRLIGEHVALKLDPGDGGLRVLMDPTQLEQVVINLAVNARDAMPGGGTLSISTRGASLGADTPGVAPGDFVCISVSDTGTGMSAKVKERIFEPFFTTKPVGKGTGLGLSMVYGIVGQNGGHIEVESEPGRGSIFRLFFKRHEGAGRAAAKKGTAELRAPGTGTILLVEDEEPVRRATARILRSAGYRVEEAGSGEEAIQRFGTGGPTFDLVLTDVVMPGMGGAALARRLHESAPAQKIVFCSGYTDEMITSQGDMEEGAFILQKPVDAKALLKTVEDILRS